jgi:hypothetical protein
MYKHIMERPEWLHVVDVADVFSLSNCVSRNFTDYFSNSKHNGHYLFDSPSIIESLAGEHGVSLAGLRLLYFEAFEHEYDEEKRSWSAFSPDAAYVTNVQVPSNGVLRGFDVTCFDGAAPGCSPLSCNYLARTIPTNEHCLLPSLEDARNALEQGQFKQGEPGPYRIIAVYTVEETLSTRILRPTN